MLVHDDCFKWLEDQKPNSIHGVVTDPPYGVVEFASHNNQKRVNGNGGVWRIPPSFDGFSRSPVPRFTILDDTARSQVFRYFRTWGKRLLPILVPGAHVIVASNPLVAWLVNAALVHAGFEPRGEFVRLVQTLRGGDRPKNAHLEFTDVSAMARSMWEPWVVVRKPLEGRLQDNLRKWGTGGLRRLSADKPFGDVFKCPPAGRTERGLTEHPTLKPQRLMRHLVRAALPLGKGVLLDSFAGSGSTLAAAISLNYQAIGVEANPEYFVTAGTVIPSLAAVRVGEIPEEDAVPELFDPLSMKRGRRRSAG